MRIAVIGSGYVGLVSAACFAEIGHEVISVDNDIEKIAALERGEIPIHERGLPEKKNWFSVIVANGCIFRVR